MLGVAAVQVPRPGWKPAGYPPKVSARSLSTGGNVGAKSAIRTPQFWLLRTVLFTNMTVGIDTLENASPMIRGFFSSVTPARAAGFVGVLSLANMAGRFGWSSLSDVIGRKYAYVTYLGIGGVAYSVLALFGAPSTVVC